MSIARFAAEELPLIYQFARTEEERQLFKLGRIKPNNYARPYAMPPGVPQDRAHAMEAAFRKRCVIPT